MSTLYRETEKWVEKIYFNANHLVRAVYWVKKLNPLQKIDSWHIRRQAPMPFDKLRIKDLALET